jgi:hypothetical protein
MTKRRSAPPRGHQAYASAAAFRSYAAKASHDAATQLLLSCRVSNRTQQGGPWALAVHAVLPRRERDGPAAAVTLPTAEADQLQARKERLALMGAEHVYGQGMVNVLLKSSFCT